jgi:hypothetical protein
MTTRTAVNLLLMSIQIAGFFWVGYVCHLLWGWHLVPIGAPPVGTWPMAVVVWMTRLLTVSSNAHLETVDELERVVVAIAVRLAFPALALAVGWCWV